MTLKKIHYKIFLSVFLFLSLSIIYSLLFNLKPTFAGTKGASVVPTRVIIDWPNRVAKFRLINNNKEQCRYIISANSMQMSNYGKCTKIESPDSDDIAIQRMLRFSPRKATLAPGEWQTIRLMVRKPANLADGEYRVNLLFEPLPDFKEKTSQNKQNQAGLSVHFNYVINISVPVIMRFGTGGFVKITPHKPVLTISKAKKFILEIEFFREGSYSFYGDVIVYHIDSNGTSPKEIGSNKGFSIYASSKKRIVKVPISDQNKQLLSNGKIKVDILNREKKGLPVVCSESFNLPLKSN